MSDPSGPGEPDTDGRVAGTSFDAATTRGPAARPGAAPPGRFRAWVDRRRHKVQAPELTAFVLAGGGSRGAVQVGMLAELVDRGIRADRVYGASVGAINGAGYCGDPTPRGMDHLQEVWRELTGEIVFPRTRVHGPWTYFQQRPSVHPNSGLRGVVENGITFENIEDAPVPFEVVTTSMTDGRERWISEGPAVDALLASAAIPAMFPPVVIDGETLIDGGVVDNVPISRAIAAGATRIYVLLCGPLHYRPAQPRRPVEAVLTAFFVAIHARFARELTFLPPGVEVIVFSGGGEPSADYRDFSATSELIEEGRAEVARVLDRTGVPESDQTGDVEQPTSSPPAVEEPAPAAASGTGTN
jgi:NTE family protein